MSNDYFDAAALAISNGTRGDAPDVNNVSQAVETAFGLLPNPDKLKQGRNLVLTAGGTANALTFTTGLSLGSYVTGTEIQFLGLLNNTGATTALVDGVANLAVTLKDGSPLPASSIVVGQWNTIKYDGSKWVLYSTDGSASSTAAAASAAAAAASEVAASDSAAAALISENAAAASAASIDPATLVKRDGSATMTGDLDFDGNNVVGLADGVADDDAATVGQVNAAIDEVVQSGESVRWLPPQVIGQKLAITAGQSTAVAAHSSSVFAHVSVGTAELRRYQYNGNMPITLVGSGLSITGLGVQRVSLSARNVTDAVMLDSGNKALRLYRWGGSAYALVGTGTAISGIPDNELPAISVVNGGAHVAMFDNGNKELRLYAIDGDTGAFSLVGSGTAIAGTSVRSTMTTMNATHIAFADSGNDELRLYSINIGTGAFTLVGAAYTLPAVVSTSSICIAAMNGEDVLFLDDSNNDFMMLRTDFSTGWFLLNPATASAETTLGALSLTSPNGTDVIRSYISGIDIVTNQFLSYNSRKPYLL
jgi:hypothetical protein